MKVQPKLDKLIDIIKHDNSGKCKPISWYKPGQKVTSHDKMAPYSSYTYTLVARYGRDFDPKFRPKYTPHEMLVAGVFEGKYLNDLYDEFPREWYADALRVGKLSPDGPNPALNKYKAKSRLPIQYWREKGWIPITKSHNVDNVAKKIISDIKKSAGKEAKYTPAQQELIDAMENYTERDATDYDARGWFQWYCRYYIGRRQPIIDHIQINRWRSFVRHKNKNHCTPIQKQALFQWAHTSC